MYGTYFIFMSVTVLKYVSITISDMSLTHTTIMTIFKTDIFIVRYTPV